MLLVKVEVNGHQIGEIRIHNDGTGSEEVGFYNVMMVLNDKSAVGRVEFHEREKGAMVLIRDALDVLLAKS